MWNSYGFPLLICPSSVFKNDGFWLACCRSLWRDASAPQPACAVETTRHPVDTVTQSQHVGHHPVLTLWEVMNMEITHCCCCYWFYLFLSNSVWTLPWWTESIRAPARSTRITNPFTAWSFNQTVHCHHWKIRLGLPMSPVLRLIGAQHSVIYFICFSICPLQSATIWELSQCGSCCFNVCSQVWWLYLLPPNVFQHNKNMSLYCIFDMI